MSETYIVIETFQFKGSFRKVPDFVRKLMVNPELKGKSSKMELVATPGVATMYKNDYLVVDQDGRFKIYTKEGFKTNHHLILTNWYK